EADRRAARRHEVARRAAPSGARARRLRRVGRNRPQARQGSRDRRMRLARLAIGNVNATVGACRSNVDRAIACARAAAAHGATLVALPEQVVGGYPPEDLVQWRSFVEAQRRELMRFAAATKDVGAACAIGLTVARGAHVYNAVALVHGGRVHGIVPKE